MAEVLFRNIRLSDGLERRRVVAAQTLGEDERVVMRLAYHFGWMVMARGFTAFEQNEPYTVKVAFVKALELGEEWNDTMSRCNLSPGHDAFLSRMSKKLGRPDGELIRTAIMLGFDAMGETLRIRLPWEEHELVQLVNLERISERKERRREVGRSWPAKPIVRKKRRSLKQ